MDYSIFGRRHANVLLLLGVANISCSKIMKQRLKSLKKGLSYSYQQDKNQYLCDGDSGS